MGRRRRERAAPGRWTDDHQRPRVLVEHPDGASRWAMTSILERAGYRVEACGGPTDQRCPLLDGDRCPLSEGADIVWNQLDLRGTGRLVLEHVLAGAPGTPVVVEIPAPERRAVGPILDAPGVTCVDFPVMPDQVVSTVERLLGP